MTKFDAEWARAEEIRRKWLAENGMYSEAEEHSSCGVGLVVSIDGAPSRKVVEAGIEALRAGYVESLALNHAMISCMACHRHVRGFC